MIVLIDFLQIIISNAVINNNVEDEFSLDLLRNISLRHIFYYKNKFNVNLSDIIVCFDNYNYWRKSIFPFYKGNRKKNYDSKIFDWKLFFKLYFELKKELKNELSIKIMEVDNCEADDIIAVLSDLLCERNIVVVSSDKDLIQLQTNTCNNLKQYSPYHRNFIDHNTQKYDLFEHIIKGDVSDGIPNIRSDDDTCISANKRNKSILSSDIIKWKLINDPNVFCDSESMLRNYNRNLTLIDLKHIPTDVKLRIIERYMLVEESYINNKNNFIGNTIISYLIKHGLHHLI